MAYTDLTLDGPVAVLTLNRPEAMNRLNNAFLAEIRERVEGLNPQTTVALIITGAGDQVFSAGYDIEEIPAGASLDVLAEFERHNPIEMTGKAIESRPFPVICLVNGKLYGGAMEILLSSDIKWAADTSELCLPPARLGVLYEPMGLWRLIDAVGYPAAAEMVYSAAVLPAERALQLGLVTRVIPSASLMEEGLKLAHHMSRLAPLTIRNSKTAMKAIQARTRPDEAQIAALKELRIACFQSEDVQEGKRAFLEKRKPEFKGR